MSEEKKERYWPAGQLRERGWSDQLMEELLPAPSYRNFGRRRCRCWPKSLVIQAEQTKEYQNGRQKRSRRETEASASVSTEINLLGIGTGRHYPRRDFWEIAAQTGNQVILGTDAHQIEQVWKPDVIAQAEELADELQIPLLPDLEEQLR